MTAKFWRADGFVPANPANLQTMTYNFQRGGIDVVFNKTDGSKLYTTIQAGQPGETIEVYPNDRIIYAVAGAGEVVSRWQSSGGGQVRYWAMDQTMLKIAVERTQAAQRAAQEASDSNSDFLGNLLGGMAMAGGMASGSDQVLAAGMAQAVPELAPLASGGSVDQVYANSLAQAVPELAPIVQGAAAGAGGGSGGVAGSFNPYTGLPTTGGGAPVRSAAAGATSGGAVRASYPTQPNVAIGPQCPGFTLDNYRTHAFEGGGDQQLFSLCGQAFEYYSMYLRAISQGYSEADSLRTYDAHQKAAQQAKYFYDNNR
jgi:hypothetical protein